MAPPGEYAEVPGAAVSAVEMRPQAEDTLAASPGSCVAEVVKLV